MSQILFSFIYLFNKKFLSAYCVTDIVWTLELHLWSKRTTKQIKIVPKCQNNTSPLTATNFNSFIAYVLGRNDRKTKQMNTTYIMLCSNVYGKK